MAKLGCPCGNTLRDSGYTNNPQCAFYPWSEMRQHLDDLAFFDLSFTQGTKRLDIWQCWECDRLMVFDDPDSNRVTRFFKRICADGLPEEVHSQPYEIGIFFNDAFFDSVETMLSQEGENDTYSLVCASYEPDKTPFTIRMMMDRVFDKANGKLRNWWNAADYGDWIALYDCCDSDLEQPLKLWCRYDPSDEV